MKLAVSLFFLLLLTQLGKPKLSFFFAILQIVATCLGCVSELQNIMSKASEKKSPGASDGTKFSGAKEPLVNYPVSVFAFYH